MVAGLDRSAPSLAVRPLDELSPTSALGRTWERLVATNPASGIMQSRYWSIARQRQGLVALHLGLFDADELIGGMVAYQTPHGSGPGLLVAPEGPVLPWTDRPRALAGLRLLLAAAASAIDQPSLALRIEPRLSPPQPRLLRAFGRAPVDQLPIETLYLDLEPSLEAILAGMRPKGRYNIRLAERHGVTVQRDDSPAAAQRLYSVLTETSERNDFFIEPLSFFSTLIETLRPAGLAHCLFAEHAGQTLGALLLTTYGQRATYLYGGVANLQRPLMAGYALQWGAIQLARQRGCRHYDFYGYEPYGEPDHDFAGFSRFKRQFGGQPIRFIGAHDYFFVDHLADLVVRAVRETLPAADAAFIG